jgi:hypothetical protein
MAEFVIPVESITDQKMHIREGILLLIVDKLFCMYVEHKRVFQIIPQMIDIHLNVLQETLL